MSWHSPTSGPDHKLLALPTESASPTAPTESTGIPLVYQPSNPVSPRETSSHQRLVDTSPSTSPSVPRSLRRGSERPLPPTPGITRALASNQPNTAIPNTHAPNISLPPTLLSSPASHIPMPAPVLSSSPVSLSHPHSPVSITLELPTHTMPDTPSHSPSDLPSDLPSISTHTTLSAPGIPPLQPPADLPPPPMLDPSIPPPDLLIQSPPPVIPPEDSIPLIDTLPASEWSTAIPIHTPTPDLPSDLPPPPGTPLIPTLLPPDIPVINTNSPLDSSIFPPAFASPGRTTRPLSPAIPLLPLPTNSSQTTGDTSVIPPSLPTAAPTPNSTLAPDVCSPTISPRSDDDGTNSDEDEDSGIAPDSPPPFRLPPPPSPAKPPGYAPPPPAPGSPSSTIDGSPQISPEDPGSVSPEIPQAPPPAPSPAAEGVKSVENKLITANSRKFARSISTKLFDNDGWKNVEEFESNEESFDKHFRYPSHIKVDFNVWAEKRDRTAYEVLTTEITYVRNLQILYTVFQPRLMARTRGSTDYAISVLCDKFEQLFPTIKNILAVNSILLSSLAERYEKWSNTQVIGDVLCTLAPFLSIYKLYSQVYGECAIAIRAAEKVKDFALFLETLKSHPLAHRQPIGSFLITPVQRVPRYVLLIQDLLKNTDPSHPDYPELNIALQTLQGVATGIDQSISAQENLAKCSQIQELFTNYVNIVAPHRKYIADGLLLKQCRKDRKERQFAPLETED